MPSPRGVAGTPFYGDGGGAPAPEEDSAPRQTDDSACGSSLAGGGNGTEPFVPEPARVVRELAHEARVLDLVQKKLFPEATAVTVLARGSESLVLRVRGLEDGDRVVRAPRSSKFERYRRAYANEVEWLRAAREADPEGGRHLAEPPEYRLEPTSQMPVLVLRRPPIATLAERLERFGPERARREPKFVLRAWRQLALAVRALHRIGVVHRDIKPSNVLWLGSAAAPHFWLSDLGIAARQGTQVHGLEGLMSGTLSHMSVNQLGRGSASFADDLYALGVTFREMLVGQTVWTLDPGRPENHVELHWVNEFGTYPILRGLPDPVAAVVPPSLQRLVDGRDTSDDSIDALLERLAVDPT